MALKGPRRRGVAPARLCAAGEGARTVGRSGRKPETTQPIAPIVPLATTLLLDPAMGGCVRQGKGELVGADSTRLVYRWWHPDGDDAPGEVVAFLPGVGGHSGQPTYEYFVDFLVKSGRAAYGLDLRGFGLSDGRPGHVDSWSDYIDDVRLFVDVVAAELPGTPVFLFGQSLGGLIALECAADGGLPLNGLVVSAPAAGHPDVPTWLTTVVRAAARVAPTVSVNPRVDVAGFTRDPADVARLQQDELSHRRVTACFAVAFDDAVGRVLGKVGQITMPVLVLVGSDDPVISPDVSRNLIELVGAEDKRLIVYENGYHQPILDIDRQQVFHDIDAWINDHRR